MDLSKIPFSCCGSYQAISVCPDNYQGNHNKEGIYLRTLHGNSPYPLVLRFRPLHNGHDAPYRINHSGDQFVLNLPNGQISFCFDNPHTILIRGCGENIGLLLDEISQQDSCNYIHPIMQQEPQILCVNCYKNQTRHVIGCINGSLHFLQDWDIEEAHDCCIEIQSFNGTFTCYLREVEKNLDTSLPMQSYEAAQTAKSNEISTFAQAYGGQNLANDSAIWKAAYVQWMSLVEPKGNLMRETMLMSKNWMSSVWAWDHCFNAIALCYADPVLAWDQFMVLFDHQDKSGLIPDFVNDTNMFYNCCKPPVHGWALQQMMNITSFSNVQLQAAYEKLSAWTCWWLTYRDLDGDGICEYWHGNDSGWDNSTVFHGNPCVISPDLCTWLILQMECLSDLAKRLGNPSSSQEWAMKAADMQDLMLSKLFIDDLPYAIDAKTHKPIRCNSLLPYLSLLLGNRLPRKAIEKMQTNLTGFRTTYGIATEALQSAQFQEDGYWRGAIWPPIMLLMTEALCACGNDAMAHQITQDFCRTVESNGFSENYCATSGKGLRDPAYTWAASVYLVLCQKYKI